MHERPGGNPTADIAIIGGSGFYELLEPTHRVEVTTPYGPPSDAVTIGTVDGRAVAFLPRHGATHALPAHRINYRANLWALRSLGVRRILAPCAVGSLRDDLGPGSVVVPDQLVDRTRGRAQTFYDHGAVHVSFADPYCETGRTAVLKAASESGEEVHDGGVMVVVEGPRFSTRAESRWFASAGWSLVNMTGHPEAALARELALCYTSVALVTDYDAGVARGEGVSQHEVFRAFSANVRRLKDLVLRTVRSMEPERECACSTALDGMELPFELP
ncbi:S-methyl-5'-thioadenosine phosphorylase [Streptomyces filamentosus]|uniref:Purine nucleoside phosphorylase n=1 Tax=Streptomyces filamentosus TaxID=67294 RepID=A0A919BBJ5_STRFL|nr:MULTISPECIES: S-methyl-5'-thioadenosine phosphorylase [Streptomyces]KAA6211203.1 S-methyl-5'-thioadenosine phosphorylase [Streptomyces filamentosus]GHF77999.1 purine nucleoside phosphorylase [Streptomyces filamentosus]GHJ97915.1 purine nucleoside phosphorylase [Streptomyces sp. NE5-10]